MVSLPLVFFLPLHIYPPPNFLKLKKFGGVGVYVQREKKHQGERRPLVLPVVRYKEKKQF